MKLLPCPFCGKIPEMKHHSGDYGYRPSTVSIRCDCCGCGFCEVTEQWVQGVGTFSVREEAEKAVIGKWNTRS